MKHIWLLFILAYSFFAGSSVFAQRQIPPKPTKQTAVYDAADMLSPGEEKSLENKLIRYADTTSTQIVVATIPSLRGEYIALYATEWAQQWGIGQAKEDNGLLILVAKQDRELFITTGYGLEEKLTDFNTKTIIDQIITPEFKSGNFYSGLDKGTTAIFEVLDGTFTGSSKKSNTTIPVGQIIFLFVIALIIFISISKGNKGGRGGNRGNRSGGGSLLDVIILSNMGRGGFGGGSGGGSFGGGGFGGGFGGGGFGGGGAGGSW